MAQKFDCIVIGSGSAGSAAARGCRDAGMRVAVIEHRPPGGTCAQRGCIPKKVLAAAAEAVDGTRRWEGNGIRDVSARLNWTALRRFEETFTRLVPERTRESFREAGIELVEGTAAFTGPNTVRVGGNAYLADRFVLAAGARPVPLPIAGADRLATSEEFLSLDALPPRLVLVGGGFIGFEFAHIAARAGVEVTLLQRNRRALTRFDPELVERLCERTRSLGVAVHLGHEVKAVEADSGGGVRVVAEAEGTEHRFPADLAVHSAGRAPDLEALDLERARVRVEDGRPVLNEYLQSTTNPRIYAAGDASGAGPALTPVATRQGRLIAAGLASGTPGRWDRTAVPSVVFTTPPLAKAGLLPEEARRQGKRFRVRDGDASSWFTARHVHETAAGFRVLVEEETDRILGAHLLGPGASEVINLFALAMQNGLTAEQVRDTIYVFPTASSDIPSTLPRPE